MNKKFLSAILFGALMVTSTGTFVSCKDYDDDIDGINKELTEIKSQIAALQGKIEAGKWITSVTPATGGFTVTFSDGSNYTITNGKDGQDGAAGAAGTQWTISADGYWECDGVKTEVKAVGQDGAQGEAGKDAQPEVKFEDGKWFLWNGTEFVEFKGAETPAANVPYCYEDPTDPNYTILVAYTQDGVENKIRLPRTSGLGQIVVVGDESLNIIWNTFNGAHFTNGKAAAWNEEGKFSKALPENVGDYMLTASANAIYVQVIPADYDITKLNFKLVNTKGDEAPIKLEAPVECTEAIPVAARAASKSGVYAISFTLPEMTDATMNAYKANIAGKALSLVATESVRSTYTFELGIDQATADDNLTFGSVKGDAAVAAGNPYTVVLNENAEKVYDSFLTMNGAAAKADSVRYGISLKGMTISYTGEMPANTSISFKINQINARAVVSSGKHVNVTFNTKDTDVKHIILDALEPHKAVALKKNAAGKTIRNQYVDVDFKPYFDQVASTEGDRLIWNQDTKDINAGDVTVKWTEIDDQGNMKPAVDITDLIESVDYLTSAGADKVGNNDVTKKDLGKIRLYFKQDYGTQLTKLGNGSLRATITVKNTKNEALQTVEVPFSIAAPSAEEKASWFDWNKTNSYTADGLVYYTGDLSAQGATDKVVKLADYFNANVMMVGEVDLVKLTSKKDAEKDEWTPSMTIAYPSAIFEGMTEDAQKNSAKDLVTWTGFENPCWTAEPVDANLKNEITIKKTITTKYFGTYTISGIKVKAMNREISVADLKLVIKGQASRADVISFSKDLVIPSVKEEYIKLTNTAFAPYGGSFFGTFTLKDYQGRSYELQTNTTIKVADVAANGTYDEEFDTESEVISAKSVEYSINDKGGKAYGIQFTYLKETEYPAGKAFKVMLQITGAKKDGKDADVIVVPATITVGGI